MLISPIKAIESGWVTGDISQDSIQPNGIDFRLDRVFMPKLGGNKSFILREETKQSIEYFEMKPYHLETDLGNFEGWRIMPHTGYDFLSNIELNLPQNVASLIIQRSTLNRSSCSITSGLWDSGFKGTIGGQLRNGGQLGACLEHNVRIGQVMFLEAQAAHSYNGQYQSLSEHWSEGN